MAQQSQSNTSVVIATAKNELLLEHVQLGRGEQPIYAYFLKLPTLLF